MCSRLIKKTRERRKPIVVVHLLGLNNLYILFKCFYGRFLKSKMSSVLLSACSNSHNAANRAIAKKSWQSYLRKFEVLFSRKQQGAIRTG